MKNAQITKPATNAMAAIVASAPVAAAIVKADTKPAKARTVRPAQTPVTKKAESVVVKTAQVLAIKYVISTAVRPSAGRLLKAYTQAVLELLGMNAGKAYDRATLQAIMGNTAVAYHVQTTGVFAATPAGIRLCEYIGNDFIAQRIEKGQVDQKDVEDFKAILTTGKADGRLVKNPAFIKALSL